jgi:two-component system response regulator YesN
VEEYLLKPVSASDLLSSLDKVARSIEQEKINLTSIENLKKQVQSNSDILIERWLCDLVTGIVKTEDAIEKAREMKVDLIAHSYLVAIVKLKASSDNYSELKTVKLKINALLENHPDVICFSLNSDTVILLLKNISQDPLEETAYTLGQAIKYEVERNTSCIVAIGIGSIVERIGSISKSYGDADQSLKYLAKTGQKLIIGIRDLESFSEIDFLRLDGDPIAERMKYARKVDIDDIMTHYIELIGDHSIQSTMFSYYLLGDLIIAASKIIQELGGDIQDVIPSLSEKANLAEIIGSKEMFYSEGRMILEKVIDFRESKVNSKYHSMIQKAKNYINHHFADQDISLHLVASIVNVSPNHFSTIFSQETGETFIEYLTFVRISRSKELLLSTNKKSADIAYESGFGDPHYFSFIFKKNTGIAPREFRATGELKIT